MWAAPLPHIQDSAYHDCQSVLQDLGNRRAVDDRGHVSWIAEHVPCPFPPVSAFMGCISSLL